MSTRDVQLDEATFALVNQLAKARNVSAEEVVAQAVARLVEAPPSKIESTDARPVLGELLADSLAEAERLSAESTTGAIPLSSSEWADDIVAKFRRQGFVL